MSNHRRIRTIGQDKFVSLEGEEILAQRRPISRLIRIEGKLYRLPESEMIVDELDEMTGSIRFRLSEWLAIKERLDAHAV